MALIQCPVCHYNISDKAVKCPHCGNVSHSPYQVKYKDYVKSPISETRHPHSYLTESLLLGLASLILFTIWSLPFAIASFIYANQVDSLWTQGDIDGSIHASFKARKYYKIGLWLGIITWLVAIFVILLLVVGLTSMIE